MTRFVFYICLAQMAWNPNHAHQGISCITPAIGGDFIYFIDNPTGKKDTGIIYPDGSIEIKIADKNDTLIITRGK